MIRTDVFSVYHVSIIANWFNVSIYVLFITGLFVTGLFFNFLNDRYNNIYNSWIVHMCANFSINTIGFVMFGLTPQSSAAMGGFKAQGRTTESARAVIEDAIAVYKAGARCVLLEGVPEEVCAFVHKILPIPVYGIGAGADTNGQVLVIGDALGMFEAFIPKFAKKYADIAGVATQGFEQYVKEVKEEIFLASERKYKISGDVAKFNKLFEEMETEFIR